MHWFTKLYLLLGAGLVGLFCVLVGTGAIHRRFGTEASVDTSSRQGYWYTYRQPKYDAGPGRSPGGYGGGSGSGGYHGGK